MTIKEGGHSIWVFTGFALIALDSLDVAQIQILQLIFWALSRMTRCWNVPRSVASDSGSQISSDVDDFALRDCF